MKAPTVRLLLGDTFALLPTMPPESVDAIVTDPPYGLEFMGATWDRFTAAKGATTGGWCNESGQRMPSYGKDAKAFGEFSLRWATEALRTLKPGAHLLAFGGTRTFHRLACGLEDAGFQVRDCLMWLYATGFPKSLDVSRAIDATAGAEREVLAVRGTKAAALGPAGYGYRILDTLTAPATDAARKWAGWGTALKPAWEPIILARKPLKGTVAANIMAYGTGALNVDGCRIGTTVETWPTSRNYSAKEMSRPGSTVAPDAETQRTGPVPPGRWPANLILDETAARLVDEQSGVLQGMWGKKRMPGVEIENRVYGRGWKTTTQNDGTGDSGGASRFFYTAKADRDPWNDHPTLKSVDLMRWLVRLVTPPGGTVLDPFCGSGTTGVACRAEGFSFIGIEREAHYMTIAKKRLRQPLAPQEEADIAATALKRAPGAVPLDRWAAPSVGEAEAP